METKIKILRSWKIKKKFVENFKSKVGLLFESRKVGSRKTINETPHGPFLRENVIISQ